MAKQNSLKFGARRAVSLRACARPRCGADATLSPSSWSAAVAGAVLRFTPTAAITQCHPVAARRWGRSKRRIAGTGARRGGGRCIRTAPGLARGAAAKCREQPTTSGPAAKDLPTTATPPTTPGMPVWDRAVPGKSAKTPRTAKPSSLKLGTSSPTPDVGDGRAGRWRSGDDPPTTTRVDAQGGALCIPALPLLRPWIFRPSAKCPCNLEVGTKSDVTHVKKKVGEGGEWVPTTLAICIPRYSQ